MLFRKLFLKTPFTSIKDFAILMGYGFLLFKASFFIVEQMLQQVVFPFTKTDSDMVHGAGSRHPVSPYFFCFCQHGWLQEIKGVNIDILKIL